MPAYFISTGGALVLAGPLEKSSPKDWIGLNGTSMNLGMYTGSDFGWCIVPVMR
jgi:hypothetical protein